MGQVRDPAAGLNILLVSIDTLRADHLGCYGYFRETSPNIDALAQECVFFENAYAPIAVTLPSHMSMLTAVHPLEHGCFANVGHLGKPFTSRPGLRSFAEIAREGGYETGAIVSAAPLRGQFSGLVAGFNTYDDQFPAVERRGALTTDLALAWLGQHAADTFFLFVHYFDPHTRYNPPPPYDSMFQADPRLDDYLAERDVPPSVEGGMCKGRKATVTREAMNLYDGEVRYTDHAVGELMDGVRALGLWENTVVILVGDHGEGLNQHDWPIHGRTWAEQLHVPLMIHFPGLQDGLPKRFEPPVSLVDVLPTVVGRYGWQWAQSLLDQASGVDVLAPAVEPRPVFSQRSGRPCGDDGEPLYVLGTQRWRYHYAPDATERLFDLADDPHELVDVATSFQDVAAQMRAKTIEHAQRLRRRGMQLGSDRVRRIRANRQHLEELRALGYVGDEAESDVQEAAESRPATQPAGGSATDPP